MNKTRLVCEDGHTERLLALLKGRVFHRTTAEAFTSIKRVGKVLHNRDKSFGTNTGSANCFGGFHGLVCLLDLRDENPETLEETQGLYPFLSPHLFETYQHTWTVAKVVYLLLHPNYLDDEHIISNHAAVEYHRTNPYLNYVPKTEVWVKDHIPLDWIDTAIFVTFRRQAPPFDPINDRVSNLFKRDLRPPTN
jgi:hypothetical protein